MTGKQAKGMIMDHHHAGPRRPVTEETRAAVREDFPEIALIADKTLRMQVVEAWSYVLCCSDFRRIIDLPPEGNPGAPMLRQGTQADHVRGVVRLAKAMAEEFERSYPHVMIDWDILIAGAVCHDVGKPYEFDPTNRARWKKHQVTAARQPSAIRCSACMFASPSACLRRLRTLPLVTRSRANTWA